mmetsp:Transcript_11443/g.34487  ORF Transcript_11443/g.34487 Transcript_11443/m.34487 type:complete len:302 (+) Transcript_11443:186-1091(+)
MKRLRFEVIPPRGIEHLDNARGLVEVRPGPSRPRGVKSWAESRWNDDLQRVSIHPRPLHGTRPHQTDRVAPAAGPTIVVGPFVHEVPPVADVEQGPRAAVAPIPAIPLRRRRERRIPSVSLPPHQVLRQRQEALVARRRVVARVEEAVRPVWKAVEGVLVDRVLAWAGSEHRRPKSRERAKGGRCQRQSNPPPAVVVGLSHVRDGKRAIGRDHHAIGEHAPLVPLASSSLEEKSWLEDERGERWTVRHPNPRPAAAVGPIEILSSDVHVIRAVVDQERPRDHLVVAPPAGSVCRRVGAAVR